VQRRTGHEEGVASHVLAFLTQLLEVPHFANGRAPVDQEPLVQTPAVVKLWWPGFKGEVVAYQGCKVAVVEPADCFFIGLKTNGDGVVAGS